MAEDITLACLYNGMPHNDHYGKMTDGNNRTFWETKGSNGMRILRITAPETKRIAGVYIQWRTPAAVRVEVMGSDGEWITVATDDGRYCQTFIPLDPVVECRIMGLENPNAKILISELTVVTAGELPDYVHVWKDPSNNVDLMLLATHPDDEVLWFGGLMPTYAGEQGKEVLVVNAAFNNYYRRLELLNSLWTCGVRTYPILLGYQDVCSNMQAVYNAWGAAKVQQDLALLYRQYRPKVVVLHDMNGEYGHGAHRVFAHAGAKAVEYAMNPDRYINTEWEPYEVPKVYVHLWSEGVVRMNWHQPLKAFGGMTSQEVARKAYQCHESQLHKKYQVSNGGEHDNALFGLYYTAVGPDVFKQDLFENIH